MAVNTFSSDLQAQSKKLAQEMNMKIKKRKQPQWESKSQAVHRVGNRSPADVVSKEAIYEFEWGDPVHRASFAVSAFAASAGGQVWVGPKQDFYIETDSCVVGGKLGRTGFFRWCESMVETKRGERQIGLKEAISRFDREVNLKAFFIFNERFDDSKWLELHLTDSRNVLKDRFFFADRLRGQQEAEVKIVAVEISGGEVRLDLQNVTAKRTGSVWIDIKSRKVTKAVEDNEVTFSKK